jgi:hypothetical protein
MADLLKVSRGQKLVIPATAFNAFVDAAQYVAQQQANRGGTEAEGYDDGRVRVYNNTGAPIPFGGAFWFYGRDAARLCWKADPISYRGISQIGIAAGYMGTATVGWGYIWPGDRIVVVSTAYTVAVGDRLGSPVAGNYDLIPSQLGPFLVTGLMSAAEKSHLDALAGGYTYVRARYTGQRGDHVFVTTNDGSVQGAFQTLLLDGITFAVNSPGVGTIGS